MKDFWAGMDGCRAGWLAVRIEADDWCDVALFGSFADAMDAVADAALVFADVPIGLPWRGCPRREADSLARAYLGRARSSSIFNPPARAALGAETHPEASEQNRLETGLGLSCQSFNILPKIREADTWLRNHPQQTARVLEAHPEVAFSALAGSLSLPSKKAPEGHARRLDLLEKLCPGAAALAGRARDTYLRKQCAPDDVMDAMVLALAAYRFGQGEQGRFPSVDVPLPRDEAGLPMAIHFAKPTEEP